MNTKARRERRNHDDAFKAKVAIAALKEDETINKLANKFEIQSQSDTSMVKSFSRECSTCFWWQQRSAPGASGSWARARITPSADWSTDNGYYVPKKNLKKPKSSVRASMVDITEDIILSHQCELMNVGRTSVCYRPTISKTKLELMHRVATVGISKLSEHK